MKILIATPLYPPDIADPAPYVKELALRLSTEHTVEVLAYGHIPEEISGVHITVVPKYLPAFFRLVQCTIALLRRAYAHDFVLIQNGASTELPTALVGLFQKKKLILMMSDTKVVYSGWRTRLHRFATARVRIVLKDEELALPLPRPETLPFSEMPTDAINSFEQSWTEHLSVIKKSLHHA